MPIIMMVICVSYHQSSDHIEFFSQCNSGIGVAIDNMAGSKIYRRYTATNKRTPHSVATR